MSYNMWFVTPARRPLSARKWIEFITGLEGDPRAEKVAGRGRDWRQIHVTDPDGGWLFDFERYPVTESRLWAGDLEFFHSWLSVAEPVVNAQWVLQYLTRVQTVYSFRCSNSAPDSNLDLVNEIIDVLRHDDENVGGESGLLYAELEGWSNPNGHHITWEFSDRVSGPWWMALRRDDGWETFQMELGNRAHRRAFKTGKVPQRVKSQVYRD